MPLDPRDDSIDPKVWTLTRIRVMSAMELALARMITQEVKAAYGLRRATWREIGNAAGVSDTRAHNRWSKVVKGQQAEVRRHVRSGEPDLVMLSQAAMQYVDEVSRELAESTRNPGEGRPWAYIVRREIAHVERRGFTETSDGNTTLFRINMPPATIRVVENSEGALGSVSIRSDLHDNRMRRWPPINSELADFDVERAIVDFVRGLDSIVATD